MTSASGKHALRLYRPRIIVCVGTQDRKNMVKSRGFHKKHGGIREFSQAKKYTMWNNMLAY